MTFTIGKAIAALVIVACVAAGFADAVPLVALVLIGGAAVPHLVPQAYPSTLVFLRQCKDLSLQVSQYSFDLNSSDIASDRLVHERSCFYNADICSAALV